MPLSPVPGAHVPMPVALPSSSSVDTRVGAPSEGAVSVQAAQDDFQQLRRQLTNQSQLHRVKTGLGDLEKHDEDFDLLAYMRNEGDKRDQEGFKRKVVGVVWSSLSVTGVGGMKVSSSMRSAMPRIKPLPSSE